MLQKLQETLNKLTTLFSYIKLQIDNKLDIGSAAATADKLTAPFTLALSGDATATAQVDGSGPVSLAMMLKDIGVTAGSLGDSITIPVITVDSKGRVTQITGVNVRAGTTSQVGVVQLSTSVSSPSAATAATSGAVKAAYDLALTKLDAAATAAAANKLITARTISLTGDGSWTVSFDGAGNATGVMSLADSGVVAGSYAKVTVNAKGLVTGGAALTAADIPVLDAGKTTTGVFAAARIPALDYLPNAGGTLTGPLTGTTMYTSGWFRSTGATGWYSETYGGGIHMSDVTWVRVYGSKNFYCANDIAAAGDISGFYSDERLKTNLSYVSGALEIIRNVRAIRYNANDLAASFGFNPDKTEIGFSAQNVKSHVPEVVELAPFDYGPSATESASGENYMTLKYHRLMPIAFEGIRELDEKVEVNRADLDRLIMTVANLAAQIEELKSKV